MPQSVNGSGYTSAARMALAALPGEALLTPSASSRSSSSSSTTSGPGLLLLPTVTAGGDTPCHYPTVRLVQGPPPPAGRASTAGTPARYLGHPLLLYYFPLPFLVMSALAPLVGHAGRLQARAPPFPSSCFPLLAYASFRLMGFRFPGRSLGAGRRGVPLPRGRTRSGGAPSRAPSPASSPTPTASASRCCSWASPTARTPAGTGPDRPAAPPRPGGLRPRLRGAVGGPVRHVLPVRLAPAPAHPRLPGRGGGRWRFAIAGVLLLPLLSGWGYTTPYDDPWITVTTQGLFPPFLWPLFGLAARGPRGARSRCAIAGAAPTIASSSSSMPRWWARPSPPPVPPSGVIDVRFVPFAQLSLCLLAGARRWAWLLERVPRPPTSPPWAWSSWACSTATRARGCCGPGSTGTTPAWRPRSCGRPSARMSRRARGQGGRSAGGRRVQRGARAGGLHPHVRDPALLHRALHARGRLQPGQPDHPPGVLPGLRAGGDFAQPLPGDRVLALRPRRRARATCASSTSREVVALSPQLTEAALESARTRPRGAASRRTPSSEIEGGRGRYVEPVRLRPFGAPWPAGVRRRCAGSRDGRSRRRPSSSPTTRDRACRSPTPGSRPPRCPLPAGVEVARDESRRRRSPSARTARATRCW